MSNSKPTVIDLFCGCGGLSFGFIEAGYNVVLGIDHWKDAIVTFENTHNNSKGLVADLFIETPQEISTKTGIKKVDLIQFFQRNVTMATLVSNRQTTFM